jgi:hypothetical protein
LRACLDSRQNLILMHWKELRRHLKLNFNFYSTL